MNCTLNSGYIKLPNDIYDDVSISNEELTILVLLYRNYMQYKSISISSIQMLVDYMKINVSNNRKMITTIKNSIQGLIDKHYITCLYDLHYNELSGENPIDNKDSLFYVELVEPPTSNYFVIYDKDINSIFEYLQSENISKFNLIRYFLACKRVSNNQCNFGYLTQGKLKQLVTDSRTIQRYNKILQDDLRLIIYNNSYLTKEKHYCTTFIGLCNDEDNFNIQLQTQVELQGLVPTDKIISNKKRSVKQKINNLVDDKDTRIKELEAQVLQYQALQYNKEDNEALDIMQFFDDDNIDWDEEDNFNSIAM